MPTSLDGPPEFFCTGQNLSTLSERQFSRKSLAHLQRFMEKMATIYANFFLGYALHRLEGNLKAILPNHIYLSENEGALQYTLDVFGEPVSDEIKAADLAEAGIYLEGELTDEFIQQRLQPNLAKILSLTHRKLHTPPFTCDDVNLQWPTFTYYFQLMPKPFEPETYQFQLEDDGTLQVFREGNLEETVPEENLLAVGLSGLKNPLTDKDIEKILVLIQKDYDEDSGAIRPYFIALETQSDSALQYAFLNAQGSIIKNTLDSATLEALGFTLPLPFPLTAESIDTIFYPKLTEIISLLNSRKECFPNGLESCADNFKGFSREQQIGLLKKGLDLNLWHRNGLSPFTFSIGNAENDSVNEILDLAGRYQTLEQRSIWLNKPDKMIRNYDEKTGEITYVGQTPLLLAIAKGYESHSGDGCPLAVSNLSLAQKLLALGANASIDYAEPAQGNTALHLAFARRDDKAIALLLSFGATLLIANQDGKTPMDMLTLSFTEVQALLKFHTSPDSHPDTFYLDEPRFLDLENLQQIKKYPINPAQMETGKSPCVASDKGLSSSNKSIYQQQTRIYEPGSKCTIC